MVLGLAIALAFSALVNLALLISSRTRETLLSLGRKLISRAQAVRADPNTNVEMPGPLPTTPPTPPPQRPAIVWPSVRPTAPPPPPRNLYYGAKGIFETGKPKKLIDLKTKIVK